MNTMSKFTAKPLVIPEVLLIMPRVFADDRGYFKESYNQQELEDVLPGVVFVQDNESKSDYGVLRGLHFQREPHGQAKLVRTIQGKIWDVAVDIRPESPTYKQHVSCELSAENHEQLYIPRGFAHGFIVLSEDAIVLYKTDQFYNPDADAGISVLDPELRINWPLPQSEWKLSEKDSDLPMLRELTH